MWDALKLSLQVVAGCPVRCCEPNPGFLQGWQVLFTVEPSLQSKKHLLFFFVLFLFLTYLRFTFHFYLFAKVSNYQDEETCLL